MSLIPKFSTQEDRFNTICHATILLQRIWNNEVFRIFSQNVRILQVFISIGTTNLFLLHLISIQAGTR